MKNTILEYIINNKEDFNEYLMMRLNEINSDDTFDSKPGNEIIDDFEKISVLDYIKYASINDLFTVEVVEESDSDEEDEDEEDEDVDKSKDEVKEDKSKDEDVDKSKDEVKEDKSKDEDEDVDKSKDEYKKDEDKEDQDKENIDDLVRKII